MLEEILSGVQLEPRMAQAYLCLLILAYILKSTPQVKDWLISWVLFLVGIISGTLLIGWEPGGLINGAITGGLAIVTYEGYRKIRKKGKGGR
jgi:hypothetical protein